MRVPPLEFRLSEDVGAMQALVDAHPDACLVLAAGGRVLAANRAASRAIPTTHHALPILADAPVPPAEFSVVSHGERRILSAAWSPIRWGDTPARFVRLLDVTDWREQEAARDDGLRVLEEIFDALPASVVVLDDAGVIIAANARWRVSAREHALGLADDGVGVNYLDVCDRAAASGVPEVGEFARGLRSVLRRRAMAYEFEYECPRPSGTEWYRAQVTALQGAPGAVVVHADVTAIRAEQRAHDEAIAHFRAVFEQALDAMVLCDPEGRVLAANEAAAALLGLPLPLLRGERLAALVTVLEQAGAEPATVDDLLDARASARAVVTVRQSDGSLREALVSARASVVPGRNLYVFHDITETRRLESQLRHVQKIEALGQLTGGIAHDFNNVLTVVQGNADYLLDEIDDPAAPPIPPQFRVGLAAITSASVRGAEMVRKLMAFSRRDALVRAPLRLELLVGEVAAMLRRVLPETIQVVVATEPDVPPVNVDASSVQQILLNLGTNARDAMPNGTGELRLSLARRPGPARASGPASTAASHVELRVTDTGDGMDEQTLARIFEPFFTTKPVGKGTGLGMAMVYGLMAQHDGSVDVESAPGTGTSVLLRFPAHDAPAAEPPEAATGRLPRGTERVLLVEDDPAIRSLTAMLLRQKGYEVEEAESGAMASERLMQRPGAFSIVVSDVVMPGGGGASVAAAVEAYTPGMPVLWMTGYALDGVPERLGRATGWRHAIRKPWSAGMLLAAVREGIESRSSLARSQT
ncbi:MAG: ATP-binding protein [Gemmatimonadaceae bacterium]|nr:ATP-binding protein [Gemmatimonadaceae bacterium]